MELLRNHNYSFLVTTYNYIYKFHGGVVNLAHLQSIVDGNQDLTGQNTDLGPHTRGLQLTEHSGVSQGFVVGRKSMENSLKVRNTRETRCVVVWEMQHIRRSLHRAKKIEANHTYIRTCRVL